ncbi:hypothetical protein HK104_004460 [Borealophlyctis nickersoniae]|nr:hypothetical protein HK104_004460 [Borealophlyctis nickersoniae]
MSKRIPTLPHELWTQILQLLPFYSLITLSPTSRSFNAICTSILESQPQHDLPLQIRRDIRSLANTENPAIHRTTKSIREALTEEGREENVRQLVLTVLVEEAIRAPAKWTPTVFLFGAKLIVALRQSSKGKCGGGGGGIEKLFASVPKYFVGMEAVAGIERWLAESRTPEYRSSSDISVRTRDRDRLGGLSRIAAEYANVGGVKADSLLVPLLEAASKGEEEDGVICACEFLLVCGQKLDRADARKCNTYYRRLAKTVEKESCGPQGMALAERVLNLRKNKWLTDGRSS